MSEIKEPCEVEQIGRKNATEKNEVENTPLVKRNKEEQLCAALRLRRGARLEKMKRTRRDDTTLRLEG